MSDDYQAHLILNAPVDRVFDALTTTDGLAAWWVPVTGDGLSGGELAFTFGPTAVARMRVDVAERASGVQWTNLACHLEDWVGTTIHFDLEAAPEGGCELRFRHAGLTPKLECYGDCKSGWDHYVTSLQAYVETGVGNPTGSAADVARREAREQERASASVG
jgi:uncharacterized protein YndB with AHSA1/START domain